MRRESPPKPAAGGRRGGQDELAIPLYTELRGSLEGVRNLCIDGRRRPGRSTGPPFPPPPLRLMHHRRLLPLRRLRVPLSGVPLFQAGAACRRRSTSERSSLCLVALVHAAVGADSSLDPSDSNEGGGGDQILPKLC